MKSKREPTVQLEVVNTSLKWMYLPWCAKWVEPNSRAVVRMPVVLRDIR